MDIALQGWVLACLRNGQKVTGDLIKGKACQLMKLMDIPPEEQLALSNAWLDKIKH